jgi:branched-subunit amino acid ABC-type transport system permease component
LSSLVASLLVAGSVDALTYWSLAVTVAAGLTVAFGMLGFLNAAHTSFYILGGYVAYTVVGDSAFAVAPPPSLAGRTTVLGATLPVYHLFIIGVAVVLVCVIAALLLGTRLGMVIGAASVHPEMVGALGFKVRDIYTLVFAVGLYLAAFAGVVMAPLEGGLSGDGR